MNHQNVIKNTFIETYNELPLKRKAAEAYNCSEAHIRNIANPDKDFDEEIYIRGLFAVRKASSLSFIEHKESHEAICNKIDAIINNIEVTESEIVTA